tara:strand:+ start:263 stop:613 length:351 start_codon:yes stop_codon:yes gene_type:complete
MSDSEGRLQDYSVDQLAGAFVLVLGAIASLLLVVWQSKCHCKVNLCYLFQCERRPPNEEEMKGLKHQAKKLNEIKNKENTIIKKEDDILQRMDSNNSDDIIPKSPKPIKPKIEDML